MNFYYYFSLFLWQGQDNDFLSLFKGWVVGVLGRVLSCRQGKEAYQNAECNYRFCTQDVSVAHLVAHDNVHQIRLFLPTFCSYHWSRSVEWTSLVSFYAFIRVLLLLASKVQQSMKTCRPEIRSALWWRSVILKMLKQLHSVGGIMILFCEQCDICDISTLIMTIIIIMMMSILN